MTKSKMLLLRSCKETSKRVDNCLNKFPAEAQPKPVAAQDTSKLASNDGVKTEDSTFWIPDRRTGIYYPKGHEHVLDDVPAGGASFSETYWFRSDVAVQKN
ncbi:putative Late embryogenesis abundant protein Lea5 [Quillaja saponaria]|uniref:Late embryogenesis abundant protein Lea5 n=1 Tax=Quillaja saponaria TaxID=32244 RepID=A0AAD7M0K5_QUISA|nr:putative Late embryogenesis abundant protein Lea5 [Quillaja saponaria]